LNSGAAQGIIDNYTTACVSKESWVEKRSRGRKFEFSNKHSKFPTDIRQIATNSGQRKILILPEIAPNAKFVFFAPKFVFWSK